MFFEKPLEDLFLMEVLSWVLENLWQLTRRHFAAIQRPDGSNIQCLFQCHCQSYCLIVNSVRPMWFPNIDNTAQKYLQTDGDGDQPDVSPSGPGQHELDQPKPEPAKGEGGGGELGHPWGGDLRQLHLLEQARQRPCLWGGCAGPPYHFVKIYKCSKWKKKRKKGKIEFSWEDILKYVKALMRDVITHDVIDGVWGQNFL